MRERGGGGGLNSIVRPGECRLAALLNHTHAHTKHGHVRTHAAVNLHNHTKVESVMLTLFGVGTV